MHHLDGAELADEELVARIQRGEVRAFSTIYERHKGRLARFLRLAGVPETEVDDLLSETFCRALEKIEQFNPGRATRYLSYLYSIARNLAADRVRSSAQPVSLEDLGEGDEPAERGPEDAIVEQICQREQVALIRRAMERLSPADAEILTLAYDRELSCREIQEITGKPSITAVTTHVYRAMKKLRDQVQELAARTGAR
jgi:RNA polymerase sigma-70 factor (ECF subfamily)